MLPGSGLYGTESLERARTGPTLFFGNHISFSDANVLEHLVTRTGLPRDTVGEVLTVSVRCGPELFSIILMFWDAACRAHALQSREATP